MARDTRYESWLDRRKAIWQYIDSIPISHIDEKQSLENQARFIRINREKVEEYALAMLDGASFPAIIVRPVGVNRFVTITGNHRLLAAKTAEALTIDAYVVTADDQYEIESLTRFANQIEGDRDNKDAVVIHAAYLVQRYGRTQKQVCVEAGIPVSRLSVFIRETETRERLSRQGVNVSGFKTAHLLVLGSIKNDNVATAFAHLMAETKMPESRAKEYLRDIHGGRTEKEQLDAIDAIRMNSETRERKALLLGNRKAVPRSSERTQFNRLLTQLLALTDRCPSFESMQITSAEDRKAAIELCNRWNQRVRSLMGGGASSGGPGINNNRIAASAR